MENSNPSSTLGTSSQEPSVSTYAKIKELELRTQQRNNFEEELFKDRFPTEKELAYHKELLGEPQPPFSTLEPKIRKGDPWSLKIPCVIDTVYTGHAYIDLQSPVNIMSRAYHNKIREKSFQARRPPYQPYKFCNFVRRAKNVHISIGCFVYVVDFMILEDLASIIDRLIRFAQRDDEVVFRMPQRTKELDLVSSLEKDKFEAFFVENLKVRKKGFKHVLEKRKGYYKACINLGRRKAYLLEDKQIPSVGVFDEVFNIWKAFGGNTHELGSFGEETDKTTNLHQHLSRISTQKLETPSQPISRRRRLGLKKPALSVSL
ncbi:hypothetical protein Tco_1183129 [Tanacetum coccineum]